MESDAIEKILESVAAGKTTPAEALLSLKKEPFTDLGYAKVDHHRALRQNATEVIYGEGKTPDQICGIAAVFHRVLRLIFQNQGFFRHAERRHHPRHHVRFCQTVAGQLSSAEHQLCAGAPMIDFLRRRHPACQLVRRRIVCPQLHAEHQRGVIRRLHSASSMASSACGFAAIRSAPASFRLSTERNPQLTAQQATPALRAVSTSTSESPMYTVSSLVTPI